MNRSEGRMAPSLGERPDTMTSRMSQLLSRVRSIHSEPKSPRLADESRWYTEHTALVISTLKWSVLGAAAGLCVGFGTRGFLWTLANSEVPVRAITRGAF